MACDLVKILNLEHTKEISLLKDLKNECELNSLENQSSEQ